MATHKEKIIALKSHMIESLKQKVTDNSLYTVLNASIPNVDDQQMFYLI